MCNVQCVSDVQCAVTMCLVPIVKVIYCYNKIDSSLSLVLHEPRFVGLFSFIEKWFRAVKVTETKKRRAKSKGMN